ncbi:assimilatory nitrate reductase catalytic subunit NasC [Evansella cellulosilytica]|uniref:Molybdopterin oxidoreductase n=1 Tax=Evansella cellulosilytica (strain ATCC 21833 / DSM 2522 / FERM P-1141 / JCM 9156 / N-4) TaxID=649639 RepID=E6U1A3_EVAC2|nr:molybdopterin oxidoreductase family protein [Evansella cellulosilytica]ADU29150.1 molybdopterin oxidoreductase [Evansella cellulosilytica DSM 2522]
MSDFLKHFRTEQLEKSMEKVMTTQCPYCSVQCSMELTEERIVTRKRYKAKPNKQDRTSEGRMCMKGANAHQHVMNGERITSPLLKIDGEFCQIPWELAIEYIVEQFKFIQKEDGNDALGVYGGGSLTNEEAYLLGKFARVALKTKHIDYNGRFCMSAAAAAGNAAFGMDRGLTNSLSEIPDAKCIILAGTNIADCQPTIVPYFRKAKKNGAFITVIDPRETGTSKLADLHLQVKPGTDALVANAMLKVLFDEGYTNDRFISERTNGFHEVKGDIQGLDLQELADLSGVKVEDITLAAREYGKAETGFLFTARGVEQHSHGYENVRQYLNLVLATGKIGKYACGYGAITGQGNGQGGREHGQKADQLPGYRSIENEEHRKYIASVWGVNEAELPRKGVSAYELIEKVDKEEITAMFVMGSNPVVSNPNAIFVEKALKKLKFLVVVDMFVSETARMADLILPTSSYLEDEGTMTNLEGRVVLRKAERTLPGDVKHDWQIMSEIASSLGFQEAFSYTSAEDIFNELRLASRGGIADYYGITYNRLKEEGIFWPCPDKEHPGTSRIFDQTFAHPDGKALFYGLRKPKLVEEPSEQFPLLLTTGRIMEHYLSGTQTRRSPELNKRAEEPLLEIHPETAKKYRINNGELFQLRSRRGSMIIRSSYSEKIRRDTIFAPFHWGDSQSINRVTNPVLDPFCKMPEFKVCSVSITPLIDQKGGSFDETMDQTTSKRKQPS